MRVQLDFMQCTPRLIGHVTSAPRAICRVVDCMYRICLSNVTFPADILFARE